MHCNKECLRYDSTNYKDIFCIYYNKSISQIQKENPDIYDNCPSYIFNQNNDLIVKAYITWFTKRCLVNPTDSQIKNFLQSGYKYVRDFIDKGHSFEKAFAKWDAMMNE